MNRKGITLIELVVVMVIISLGALLMAPNLRSWLVNYRLRSATRDIVSTMRLAQIKAVSVNTEYGVLYDPNGGTYILQRGTGGLWIDEGVSQNVPAGIQFNTNFANNRAVFTSRSTSNGGSIFLQNSKGTRRTITVLFSTGKIAIR